MAESGAVVVAVDGSQDSARSVSWAMTEARAQQVPLALVHCIPRARTVDDVAVLREQRDRVDELVRVARVEAARTPQVDLSVRRVEPPGLDIGRALVGAAGAAETLVIGAHGHGTVATLVLGSVSQYAVRHARGTVVVVRATHDPTATRTVVGFDDSVGAEHALGWALSRTTSGAEVVALRAWHGPARHGPGPALPPVVAGRHEHELAMLQAGLDPWRDKHPDVRLLPDAVHGHPGHLLSTASQHAALLVVGTGHRGPWAAALLGSVAQAVLHHSRCPVAVVR